MYKYRRLTIEELELLKDDFIKFLALNGIDSEAWGKLKTENNQQSLSFIDLFSDIVFEKSLGNIQYLEFFDGQSMKSFKCEADNIYLCCLESQKAFNTWSDMLKEIDENPHIFSSFKTQKTYNTERNLEIFKMLDNGASINNSKTYELLYHLTTNE